MDDTRGWPAHAVEDQWIASIQPLTTIERPALMQSLARRHPIAVFLAIAYSASAAIFAIPLLSAGGIGVIDLELPGMAPFILLSTFSLTGAAFLTTALAEGRSGTKDLRRRALHVRVHPGWYALGLVLLPLTALATVAVIAGRPGPIAELVASPDLLVTVFIGALVAFLLVNWWEETAWTGFALHRLQPRIGPIGASIVTTWLQAILHLPLVFVADGVTDGRVPPEQIPFYLVALFVLPIPVRIVITGLYNATGHSLPIVGLFHAGLGVATGSGFLPVLAPDVNVAWAYAGFAVLAIVILAATRGRLGYGGHDVQSRSQNAAASPRPV